jgi:hypothetical protein
MERLELLHIQTHEVLRGIGTRRCIPWGQEWIPEPQGLLRFEKPSRLSRLLGSAFGSVTGTSAGRATR